MSRQTGTTARTAVIGNMDFEMKYNPITNTYFLGVNNKGLACYASGELLAQKGEREVLEQMSLVRRYPVRTNLSGSIVMVEGSSHEDAINRYLRRKP
jgi:hypothetical protein